MTSYKRARVYDDLKNIRSGRRLPITHATVGLITAQQQEIQERIPGSNPDVAGSAAL